MDRPRQAHRGRRMKADKGQIARALDAPSDGVRLYLLYGPDEAGSNALVARLAKAMGEGAERTDFTGDQIAADPAALTDAAAAISLFGDKSWVRVTAAGESALPAIDALLTAPAAGNPVAVLAGALRKDSKLLNRCLDDKAALCFASYPPEERDAAALAVEIARERGLRLDSALARRIVDLAGGDRALMAGEVEKLALYHDATPEAPREATAEALDALSSAVSEQNAPELAGLALMGDVPGFSAELAQFRAQGGSLIGVLRIALTKAAQVAEVRAAIEGGTPAAQAMRVGGRPLYRKEADEMTRMSRCWTGETIARGIVRLGAVERQSRTAGAIADTLVAQELLAIARQAARRR